MSSVTNFIIRNTLRMNSAVQWYVDVPRRFQQHRSSFFVVHGRKMFFRFSNSVFGISVDLLHEGRYEEALRPFSVSIFAHLDKKEKILNACDCSVLETPKNIWRCDRCEAVISAMESKLMRFTFFFDKVSGLTVEDPEHGTKPGFDSTLLQKNLESLSVDFGKMLEASAHADVQIQCNGGVVNAHRAVLASRSKVFDRMFQSDMQESRTGIIEMVDAEIEAVKFFVQFIYSGKICGDPPVDIVYCLYKLADKYDVSNLKDLCSDLMAIYLSKKSRN